MVYGIILRLELEITALSYNTGIFDGPITGYHRAINIPYPLRDIYPTIVLIFLFQIAQKQLLKGRTGTGFGDAV